MHYVSRFFYAFFLIIGINSLSAQNTQAAVDYMSTMNEHLGDIKGETWRYLKAATQGKSARRVESKRQQLISELQDVRSNISKTSTFEGDPNLRDEALNYLGLTITVIKGDFEKILDMEEIAERSYDDMEAFLLAKDLANAKLDSAAEIFSKAQTDFAARNNITLVEGEQSKRDEKIAKASKALKYYNEIYLITFKATVQESYVLDALNRNDLISLEQSTNALDLAAKEGLEKLKTAEKFGSDPKLILAAQQLMEFYSLEASRDFPKIVDFYLRKDKFDKLAAMMETKKQKDLTQEEVDAYNQAVNDYNKMIPQFNTLTERSNEKRGQMLDRWNKRVEEFFEIHA
ncbi:MAG: hypothetical protein DA405_11100 [Bacteroidetes bacterium]|nr:MAG: hypothetical protein DA405_11100 [Bacteroidota bacterium]